MQRRIWFCATDKERSFSLRFGLPLVLLLTLTLTHATFGASIWPATAVPGVIDPGPDSPVELGVKFQSDVAGTITGIRFYKAAANTGTHVGNLWSSTGTRLATVTFTGETASGWQQMNFATPVTITANTTYIASYHTDVGHYSEDLNYFNAAVDNPPLHALANGGSGGNGVYAYGATSVFPNQTWRSANYWVDVVFQAGNPPTLTNIVVTPANPTISTAATLQFTATGTYSDGSSQNLSSQATWVSSNILVATILPGGLATGLAPGATAISATFGGRTGSTTLTVQAAPLSITTASLPNGVSNVAYSATLNATGGTPPYSWSLSSGSLPPGLNLNANNGAITGTPTATGTFNFTARATDSGLIAQTTTRALSITITAPSTTVSIWPNTTVPGLVDGGADTSVELGVKFRSDVAGNITGIRFYKATANTGTHVGNLWTSNGTLLASVTFTGETASGWQQMNFTTPVAISPNTTYVASYHVNNGHYSADINYFQNGVDNPPLHALASGASGGNGVYRYGTGNQFPNLTWNAANYWVDVTFQPGPPPPDTTPPTVSSVTPAAGAVGVSTNIVVRATFNEAMNASTINGNNFFLRDSSNALVAASITYDSGTRTASLTPANSLNAGTVYNATVKGGTSGVADVAGNRMSADFNWSFTTVANPTGGGPTGPIPILIVTNSVNPFTSYYSEILSTEGLNLFTLRDLSFVSSANLTAFDTVILGEMTLTAAQVTTLSNWVVSGGNLITMRPDKKLAGLLGLVDAGTTLAERYLLVNTNSGGPGAGIVSQTIQFHGTADRYTLGGASSLATLYSSATAATVNPAVTLRSVGANGGQAAAFTFDLARSVVYTRQGNPAWAGQERDGLAPMRSDDLFFGAASFDPQPDWVDLNKVAIPQADEQQRLLANMILFMNADRKLLPRFWYFPHGHDAAIVMTGDDHASGGTAGRFDQYIGFSPPNGSVADWETIRGSSYIYPNSPLTPAQAVSYNAQGFDIGVHLNTGCSDYTRESLTTMLNDQLNQFRTKYAGIPAPTTHRVHCIAWSGYTVLPEVELTFGIRLNTTYYYWPGTWVQNRPGLFTGSGMAQRFATANGALIDVYQAATQMTDESDQNYPFTADVLLDRALGPEGYYGFFVANMHTDAPTIPQSDAIVASALERGVPVISAKQLLTWLDARNASGLSSVVWSNSTQRFSVTANSNARGLQVMTPVPAGFRVESVRYNGSATTYFLKQVKGLQYAVVAAQTGNYEITFGQDTTAPTISAVQPPQGATGVSPTTDVRVTFSEDMNETTINNTTFTLLDGVGATVPSVVTYDLPTFTAVLRPNNPLRGLETHTARVLGGSAGVKDISGNSLASNFSWTFTTASANGVPVSLWNNSTTPALLAANDTAAVELGLKFTSSASGTITAIRFYKGPGNTGTHVGKLWTSTGTLLASVTFTNETTTGWQQQALTTPVAINSNTVYVVSYRAPVGRYSADTGYFSASGFSNGPLRALRDGESGGNGVYIYGASAFPNQTWNSANYWVDIVFQRN